MEMKCKRCKYKWEYKGTNMYYATCPRCYTKVKVNKEINDQDVKLFGEIGDKEEIKSQSTKNVKVQKDTLTSKEQKSVKIKQIE